LTAQALLTTNAAPAHERVGYWGDLVQRSFGRLRSRTYGDERFHGEIRRYQLGELRLCRLEASRHAVERTTGAAGASDPGDLKMVVQRRGCSVFEQGGRRALLAPGSWSVYDTTQSYTVSNPDDVLQYVLLLPRARILGGAAALRELLVRPLSGARGMGRVACETIGRALDAQGGEAPRLSPELGETILRQVRLALLEQAGMLPAASGRELLRERTAAILGERLREPGLDIEEIAAALQCSRPSRTAARPCTATSGIRASSLRAVSSRTRARPRARSPASCTAPASPAPRISAACSASATAPARASGAHRPAPPIPQRSKR
jgi:hypothetical protein